MPSYLDATPTKITTNGQRVSIHKSRWSQMMYRCYDTEHERYPDYGGRGIRVCADWQNFEKYLDGLPEGYFDGAQLDRIKNNGHYEPGNVRWVTAKQNSDNRRTGVPLTHGDRTQSMTAWAREIGVSPQLIWDRLNNWGWSVEQALTRPVMSADERMVVAREARWGNHIKKPPPPPRNTPKVEYFGTTITLEQLSALCGVPKKMLYKRIFERGWSVEKAVQPVQSRS